MHHGGCHNPGDDRGWRHTIPNPNRNPNPRSSPGVSDFATLILKDGGIR